MVLYSRAGEASSRAVPDTVAVRHEGRTAHFEGRGGTGTGAAESDGSGPPNRRRPASRQAPARLALLGRRPPDQPEARALHSALPTVRQVGEQNRNTTTPHHHRPCIRPGPLHAIPRAYTYTYHTLVRTPLTARRTHHLMWPPAPRRRPRHPTASDALFVRPHILPGHLQPEEVYFIGRKR